MKKKLSEESFIVQDMKKEFEKNPNFNYQLFHSCKKICDSYGVEQLNHAKAVLEQRKTYDELFEKLMALMISIVAVIIGIVTIFIQLKENLNIYFGLGLLALYLLPLAGYWSVLVDVKKQRMNDYFLSIINDEISKRSK